MSKIEAIINITSFRGISDRAKHFYGKLEIINLYNEELFRPITQEEMSKDPDRWFSYNEGDLTKCFKSWLDVVIAGGNKAKEKGINLEKVVVEGIPNIGRISYHEALKPLDTRPKCKKCGKVIKSGEGCYNTLKGVFCVNCYK